jgi:hypothetical protein
MRMAPTNTQRWLVVAAVDGPVVLPRIDFPQCRIVNGELRTRVSATTSDEAREKAQVLFRRATWSLLLSSRRHYDFEISSVKSLAEAGARTIYGAAALRLRLTPENTATAIELYELLRTIRPAPRRLEMAFSDLRHAVADGTPFAFVHLSRCLEQIREYFGGWSEMHSKLNVSPEYLKYVSRKRSTPEFGIAHAPLKGGPRTAITAEEIREGISVGAEVVKRFVLFLAEKPVGDQL